MRSRTNETRNRNKKIKFPKLMIFGMTDNNPKVIKEIFKELFAVDESRLKQGEEILRRWSRYDADRHIIWCMNVFSVEIKRSILLETRSFR